MDSHGLGPESRSPEDSWIQEVHGFLWFEARIQDPGFGIRDPGFGIQDPGLNPGSLDSGSAWISTV